MRNICGELHGLFNEQTMFSFPFGYDIFSYKPPRSGSGTYVSANPAAQQFMTLAEKLVAALDADEAGKSDGNGKTRISAHG